MQRKTLSALLAGFAAAAMFASSGAAAGTVMYDAVPDPLPSNMVSLGYQALSTSEFGQVINPATTGPLDSVTLTMSSWACQTGSWNLLDCLTTRNADGTLPTFDHPITINLYEPGGGNEDDAPGALIGSVTQTIAVPYRPSYDTVNCTNGGWYAADFGRCTNGYAFNATFDFTSAGPTIPTHHVATTPARPQPARRSTLRPSRLLGHPETTIGIRRTWVGQPVSQTSVTGITT